MTFNIFKTWGKHYTEKHFALRSWDTLQDMYFDVKSEIIWSMWESNLIMLWECDMKKDTLIVQSWGKYVKDLMFMSFPLVFFISPKLRNILLENNITWWKSFSIDLKSKKNEDINWYHVLQVTWRAERTWNQDKNYIGPLSAKNWDGSDMYIIDWTLSIHITPRVKEIIQREKIDGVRFKESFVE